MKKTVRALITTISCIAVIAFTAFGARALDTLLTARMAELKSSAMKSLETALGRTVTYGEIAPSFFRSIEIRELAVHGTEHPDQTLLLIHNVRVSYSLLHVLLDRDPVGAIREIRLLNTRFSLNLDEDRDVVDLLQKMLQAEGTGAGLRARITGANIGLALTSRQGSVSLDNLFFQLDAQDHTIAFSFRGNTQGRLASGLTYASTLSAQGSVDRALTSADMTVRLQSLQSSVLDAGAQTLQIVVKGNIIEARKIQDRSPIELSLRADLGTRELLLGFQSQDMRLDRLFTFAQPYARYAKWLALPLTASGHVLYRMDSRTLEYEADVSAYLEDQLPIRQVTLAASFRGTEKEAFFQPLRLSSDQGDLQFEGSLLFATMYPSGLLTLANVTPGGGEKVSAQLSIDRLQGSLDVHGTQLVIGEVAFDSLQLSLQPSATGTAFRLTTSFAGFPPEDQLQAQGDLHFGQSVGQAVIADAAPAIAAPLVTVDASLKSVPPSQLYHLFMGAGALTREQEDVFNILAQFSVSADVRVSTDFSQIAASSRQVVVTSLSDPGTTMHFGLAADSSHISLSTFSGSWRGLSIQGGFEGDVAPDGNLAFTSSLMFLGTPYSFTRALHAGRRIHGEWLVRSFDCGRARPGRRCGHCGERRALSPSRGRKIAAGELRRDGERPAQRAVVGAVPLHHSLRPAIPAVEDEQHRASRKLRERGARRLTARIFRRVLDARGRRERRGHAARRHAGYSFPGRLEARRKRASFVSERGGVLQREGSRAERRPVAGRGV